MLSLDPVKVLLVLMVALVVLGPDKLPHAARRISGFLADLRRWRESIEEHAKQAVEDLPFAEDLREAGQALGRVRGVTDPRRALSRAMFPDVAEPGPLGVPSQAAEQVAPPVRHAASGPSGSRRTEIPVPDDPNLN